MTVLNDRFLFFYDRERKNLKRKASFEVNPDFRLIKAGWDFLLLVETKGKQFRLCLVDLNKMAVVNSFDCSSFTLCDHLEDRALVIFNETDKEKLQVLDISARKKAPLFIPVKEKISCLATCKCSKLPGSFLLGLGLVKGAVQIWKIQVHEWSQTKLLEHPLHDQAKPYKDLSFIDDCRIVSGGLDKTIRLLTFNHEGRVEGEVKEFKMSLQCRGMNIDGGVKTLPVPKFHQFHLLLLNACGVELLWILFWGRFGTCPYDAMKKFLCRGKAAIPNPPPCFLNLNLKLNPCKSV